MKRLAIIACFLLCGSCEHTKVLGRTLRDGAMTAGPPALMAVLATPLGPVIQFLAVFLTTVGAKAVTDTVALATGEMTGEVALKKDNERLQATIRTLTGDIEHFTGRIATAESAASKARSWASTLWDWTVGIVCVALGMYLLGQWRWWRNAFRHWNLGNRWLAAWSVLHAFFRFLPDPPLARGRA